MSHVLLVVYFFSIMFFLVDAFTEGPFKGNPAGVCVFDEYPPDSELQKIATYYNWSEIAFLKRLADEEFELRWFSPLDEAPLCGHATLAASHIIFSNHLVPGDFVNFKYMDGFISAVKTENGIEMSFPAKPVSKCSNFPFSIKEIVGIKDYVEVLKDNLLYIIVLKSKEDVFNAVPDFVAIEKIDCRAVVITAKGDSKFDFYSRYFAPKVGIYEDPVCGSMHCRLACYWRQILGKNSFNAFQASKRTGILHVELDADIVKISGKAFTICKIENAYSKTKAINLEVKISNEFIGKRVDIVIPELVTEFSRSRIQKLIKDRKVTMNGVVVEDSSQKIPTACSIEIEKVQPDLGYEIIPEKIELDILFEDEFIVVLNKASGMVCHPAPGHKSGTLVNAIMHHFNNSLSDIGGIFRPGIVHRLDKNTSGVMLIAKTNESHAAFANLFANEKGNLIKRKYTCFVFGVPFEKSSTIETFIARHPKNRQIYTTNKTNGKYAVTLYDVEKSVYFTSTKAISKINCELLTGRTHQIRVHMKHKGHHIVGDQTYGKSKVEPSYPDIVKNFSRQALHSKELEFVHPFTREQLVFASKLPDDMNILEQLF